MIRFIKSKFIFILIIPVVLLFLVDSCIQFRMSSSEIKEHFAKKNLKYDLQEYTVGKNRVINYLHVGDESLPLIVFVHGSPGSLSAFIDFMDDTLLLKHAKLVSVDRAGFGASNYG
ncbi:MAG TPA: alpha/beta hydrolase, partial [Cytophagales bacterium]|nr:alpha/beta hydrolase [Cytophagales bacterium]